MVDYGSASAYGSDYRNSYMRYSSGEQAINEFDRFLMENNVDVLKDVGEYQHPTFINERKLFNYLDDMLYNNKKAFLHPDCDPDGLMCVLEFKDVALSFNYKNYTIWQYRNRDHRVDDEFVQEAIEKGYDYVVIFDAGTNQMDAIRKLCTFGVKVIIIDHHVNDYNYEDYPEDCVIINTIMNNKVDFDNYYLLSAGALTFTLLYKYCCEKRKFLTSLSSYALISLYSDCIDMSPKLNRSIYYMATELSASYLPRFVRDFLNKMVFKRRFIEFTLVPKINAMFRAEEFYMLNRYFFDDSLSAFEHNSLVNDIVKLHEQTRKLIDYVTDLVDRQELDNFVLVNLSNCEVPVGLNKLYNYTGIIANNIAQEFGKPCIVLCDNGEEVKGSFRDLLNRDYLRIFKQFCICGGHASAFGIHIPYIDVDYFINILTNAIDKKFYIYELEDNLIVDMSIPNPNVELLNRIALYNEFAGGSLPIALIRKKHLMDELSSYNRTSYRYKWGSLVVESKYKLVLNHYIKIKPVLSSKLKLISYTTGQ